MRSLLIGLGLWFLGLALIGLIPLIPDPAAPPPTESLRSELPLIQPTEESSERAEKIGCGGRLLANPSTAPEGPHAVGESAEAPDHHERMLRSLFPAPESLTVYPQPWAILEEMPERLDQLIRRLDEVPRSAVAIRDRSVVRYHLMPYDFRGALYPPLQEE